MNNFEMNQTKKCLRCKFDKKLADFCADKKTSDGLNSWCRNCSAEYSREYRANNKEKIKITNSSYRQINKEKLRVSGALYRSNHREEAKLRHKKRYEKNKSADALYLAKTGLKENFGLSWDDYTQMLSAQGGVCAICADPPQGRRLAVDHRHENGQIRELLCTGCNSGLGYFSESVELLRRAIEYLKKHSSFQEFRTIPKTAMKRAKKVQARRTAKEILK